MIPNKVIMLACTCTTVGAVIAAGYSAKKCNELEESLSATRTAVANGVNIDIPQVIFEEAIHQAIDSSVDAYSRTVSSRISSEIDSKIRANVKDEVDKEFNKVRGKIKEQLEKKIGVVSIEPIRKEIIEEAKEAAKKKFNDDLDKVLEQYSENLQNVSKIYQSIADSMKPVKDNAIKISV